MLRLTFSAMLALMAAAPTLRAQHDRHGGTAQSPVPLYQNLGTLHHTITTAVPLAQRYFDQGLRLMYGFNHAEAIAAFEEAARLDPTCAMCYWGIAHAYGPNINAVMDSASGVAAYAASQWALSHTARITPRERAYLSAEAGRYTPIPAAKRGALDSAYVQAMDAIADQHPEDPDAQVLHAEALMLLTPWNYWTSDAQPRPGTTDLLARLERVVERWPEHPGACHFYIHAVEAAYPERAVPCAERLPGLMPGAGHVVHMPAHIYIRVGRYTEAIERNVHAVHADEKYIADRKPQGVYPLAYYPHNYHFLAFAAQMLGRRAQALDAARALAWKVDPLMMRAPGLGALQHYAIAPLRIMVRFGMWDSVLAYQKPEPDLLYPIGVWHWGRGLAFARRVEVAAAEQELQALRRIFQDPAVAKVTIWDLNAATALLAVAERMLTGELAAAQLQYPAAIDALQQAVKLELGLSYDEPPPWELPIRDYLGAVLLDAGRPGDAEGVYRKALHKFPANGWALAGLAQALDAQGKRSEANEVRAQLQEAWKEADVSLLKSRF